LYLAPTTLCTFESPVLCNFKQDATDDFDWSQRSGSTSTSGTGPTDDHTYGSPVGKTSSYNYPPVLKW